jgi:hypothetical protein
MTFPFFGGLKMKRKLQYLKVKFTLGSISVFVGFVGATIALFQWVEKTGVQYLFGNYSRYVLGFGGFSAMIFGAFLVNDAWILREILRGKYNVPTAHATTSSSTIHEEVGTPDPKHPAGETPVPKADYKQRIVRKILRSYESNEGLGSRLMRLLKRPARRETSKKPD